MKKKKIGFFLTTAIAAFVLFAYALGEKTFAQIYDTVNGEAQINDIVFPGEYIAWRYDEDNELTDITKGDAAEEYYMTYYDIEGNVQKFNKYAVTNFWKNDGNDGTEFKIHTQAIVLADYEQIFSKNSIPAGKSFYGWRVAETEEGSVKNRNKYTLKPVFITYNPILTSNCTITEEFIYGEKVVISDGSKDPALAYEYLGVKYTFQLKNDSNDLKAKDSAITEQVISVTAKQSETDQIDLGDYTDSASFEYVEPTSKDVIIEEKDLNSITLKALEGYEYSNDEGKTWQDSPVFENLKSGTFYQFMQRKKGSKNVLDTGLNSTQLTERTYIAATDKNQMKISGMNETIYMKGNNIHFTAEYDHSADASPIEGDTRYIPTSWQANPSGTWDSAPYTATFQIENEGDYTLKVTYTKQTYHDGEWTNETDTYVLEKSFKITSEVIPPVEDEDNTNSPIIDPSTPPTNENEKPKVPSIDENTTPNVPSIDNNSDTTKPSNQKKTNTSDETPMLIFGLLLGISVVGGSICYKCKKKH